MADLGGIEAIVGCMRARVDSSGVQCNACLAIVSLVRAESEACQVCAEGCRLQEPAKNSINSLSCRCMRMQRFACVVRIHVHTGLCFMIHSRCAGCCRPA